MTEPQWQFGREYELLATYPEGAAGAIWLVRVQEDGSERAIKILRPELTGVAEVVDEFCGLLDAVRELAHPGILAPDETVVHGNRVALVMPRMAGEDLSILLERQQLLTPASTVLMIADVCDALAAAHAAGIAHGDVKPANVLLETDPTTGTPHTVRLSDFGIAPLAAHGGVVVLPDEYQPPEYIGGEQWFTPASDVYAVGVVLYEALAGHPPFTAEHHDEIARLHRDTPPPRIPVLPDQLWLLVAACLSKNPEQRPSAAELADLLREIAPTIVDLPALAAQDTIRIARIPFPPAPRPAILTSAEPAVSAVILPVETAQAEAPDEARRPVLSGARGLALAVLSGVVVVGVALALVHKAGGSAPETLTVGSATAPALALGSPSAQLTSTVTTTLSPSVTPSGSATASGSPSPTADAASASASPSASTSTVSTSPSANGAPASTAGAPVSASPSTVAASASPSKVTVSWQCATNGTQHGAITKKACIGIGSNNALYVEGIFTVSNGGTIANIKVSVYGNGQLFDTTSESCGASSCSITGGPYEPPAGNYLAYAGIDDSAHNEASPGVYYQGG